ncbi:UvrD-helicase domain-containing protein [Halioglobus pacificus]|uniref:DNA 3'-5' helicase n=1 Tax=Parahalioglobus pacificus TaxID=930806 RepID=A0A919CIT1_9GAMM|nr:UvrD-helicase domain-containing protein [Halioglobus pacificus]GHD29674.1 ATP-dependent helicase [Halioglobus pacificus]
MAITDARERAAALNVDKSFCVTAPAGSGKTELLTQRLLALLVTVQRPDQVLAITFTRKAAAEMLERVAKALAGAAAGAPVNSAHEQVTRDLAIQALATSQQQGWRLEDNLASLNIKTIDSLCMSLTRQMPILSRFGGQASPTEEPEQLYREAARELLDLVDSNQDAATDISALLLHFDNNWRRLETLFASMLRRRSQWLDFANRDLTAGKADQRLQGLVDTLVTDALAALDSAITAQRHSLLKALQYAQNNLDQPILAHFPAPQPAQLGDWRALADLLLTKEGNWRKSVTKTVGFPVDDDTQKATKKSFMALLTDLQHQAGLLEQLQLLRHLPDTTGHQESWVLVKHLARVLPLLAACLLVVFQRRSLVDYTEIAIGALDALGEEDAPTDLALRLDYSIEHILVDEFQDTAIDQYNLLQRLSRGWGEHNANNPQRPRTLFIVGDGMQSIYRFRNARVELFIKAREQGFNGVLLEPLYLRSNFRSDAGIIDWVNASFAQAFPQTDDLANGQVAFHAADAVRPMGLSPAVQSHAFVSDGEDMSAESEEAEYIALAVASLLRSNPEQSIAVLGRGRRQLQPVVHALRSHGVGYSAQDIDTLISAPAVIDLMSLCRSLANPADDVAWYSLLRSPWCGLGLADLHALTNASAGERDLSARDRCSVALEKQVLSTAGAARLSRLIQVMDWAWAKRERLGLRAWIETSWLQLGGPEGLAGSVDLEDANTFLGLLHRAEKEGVGLDIQWLDDRLQRLYANNPEPDAVVQVMTLHKSKGLEFDHVFMPGLAAGSRSDEKPLLIWSDTISASGRTGFLLAANSHEEPGDPTLFNYLRYQEKQQVRHETLRLLYVGCTRAIRSLTLSASVSRGKKGDIKPASESLLAHVWPVLEPNVQQHESAAGCASAQAQTNVPLIRVQDLPAATVITPPESQGANIPEHINNRVDRAVGTVAHEMLEDLSQLTSLPQSMSAPQKQIAEYALRNLGVAGDVLKPALERVVDNINKTLKDESGRWILDSAHEQALSEQAYTWIDERGETVRNVIDRSFVCDGQQWIIDYKTSAPLPDECLAQFLDRELEHYRPQLSAYRELLQLEQSALPVRCALYFTALGELVTL